MSNLPVKIKIFRNYNIINLQRDVNDFCADKQVVNVSYSAEKDEYNTCHYVCVAYKNYEVSI